MPLWIVRSYGGIETDREGHYDPVQIVGRSISAGTDKPVTIELLESESDEGLIYLKQQPNVISVERARDGTFEDDTEGTIVIMDNGATWRPVLNAPAPGQRLGQRQGRAGV
jgi:hypothetical protein